MMIQTLDLGDEGRVEVGLNDPLVPKLSREAKARLDKLAALDMATLSRIADWPIGGSFTYLDEPGDHDPCYVIMPGGSMLPFAHHASELADCARALFVMRACNAALAAMA